MNTTGNQTESYPVACQFPNVSVRFFNGRKKPAITEKQQEKISWKLVSKPDATLAELHQYCRIFGSVMTVQRRLARAGITRKKVNNRRGTAGRRHHRDGQALCTPIACGA
jgi:hypothetical protein